MTLRNCPTRLQAALLIVSVAVLATSSWAAPREKVLHSFNRNGEDGAEPLAGLIFDAAGNLYGTTTAGGSYDAGTVFELTPGADGTWQEKVLYSFGKDAASPQASLVFDAKGNLYGTTLSGGAYHVGTVFELTPTDSGGWKEKILHSFGNGKDGFFPYSNLIFDTSGNLYGTTYYGGGGSSCTSGCGTVFELTPEAGGGWKETILHSFYGNGKDGFFPYANLIFDTSGNLYGTTSQGGSYGSGTAFELIPKPGGGWKEKILHSFDFNYEDGFYPTAGLIFDSAGNLYGTTRSGGRSICETGCGTVFELSPTVGGCWKERILHTFDQHGGPDGYYPAGSLIFDAAGRLYGTTYSGGAYHIDGTAFELTPRTDGPGWTEKVLHSFDRGDGDEPWGGLISDPKGNLYGTTYWGGTYGWGTVFEITP
jgi:uncharacterized repeat protein (TIGR03803 family)